MEINKKSRTELKAYFVKNALPTEGNFRDLIDAGLNQKDDGLVKSADQPVQIAAATASDKPAIHLYESFATDTKPAWVLSLQADGKKGFGIGDGDGKNRLFIDGATGNVGIGTADPAGNKLRVAGNVLVDGADGKARVSFGSGNRQMLNLYAEVHGIGVQNSTTYFRSPSNFAFYKGGAHSDGAFEPGTDGAAMLVIKDGNVGIGTTTPKGKHHIVGDLVLGLDANNAKFMFHSRTATGGDFLQITSDDSNGAWDSAKGITLRRGGNVGIGTIQTGDYRLTVSSSTNHLQLRREPTETTGGKQLFLELYQEDPYVVVPTVYPSIRFHHRGRYFYRIEARDNGFHLKHGDLNNDSYIAIFSSSFQQSSDRRLKRDIVPLGPSLERVLRLQGVHYRWVDEKIGSGLQIGLIAQDVEAVFPELVSSTHEGTKGVDYARLVAPLIEAVKELAAEVEALKLARAT
ncbi:tail fiber domain-containing protein [Sorangium sp. So ce385]|uniref:tail fiber domain-containing protein n=1 Tax=Sorangium sp. So ce385 TaxID=3133308 RepID=UPI003F5CB1FB